MWLYTQYSDHVQQREKRVLTHNTWLFYSYRAKQKNIDLTSNFCYTSVFLQCLHGRFFSLLILWWCAKTVLSCPECTRIALMWNYIVSCHIILSQSVKEMIKAVKVSVCTLLPFIWYWIYSTKDTHVYWHLHSYCNIKDSGYAYIFRYQQAKTRSCLKPCNICTAVMKGNKFLIQLEHKATYDYFSLNVLSELWHQIMSFYQIAAIFKQAAGVVLHSAN